MYGLYPVVLYTLIAWLLPTILAGGWYWHLSRGEDDLLGQKWSLGLAAVLVAGTWFIPFGPVPLLIIGAVALHWIDFDGGNEKHRLQMTAIAIVGIMLAGFIPTTTPEGPEEWGEPILVENPNAALYPASQQHVWVLTQPELAAVSITTGRTSWTMNPFLGEETVYGLVSATGADKARMQASIEALNERSSSVNIDPDIFELVDIESEGKHRYKRGDIDATLDVKRQQVVMDVDLPLITLKADVLSIVVAEWGGEATILTIIRPGLSESHDVWAEDVVIQWLKHRE